MKRRAIIVVLALTANYSWTVDKIVVIGGCGHVGLPLALALADSGLEVISYDTNSEVVTLVNGGQLPFIEPGADPVLHRVLTNGAFRANSDPSCISEATILIVVIGTPVDEHLNPNPETVLRAITDLQEYLSDQQLIVLRSTVFPGVTAAVTRRLSEAGLHPDIAFCPERIAEGKAFEELYSLPQIVSGTSTSAVDRATVLFRHLTEKIVVTSPEEAELTKLFTNTWRYIKFAAANQFFMIANDFGLDFERIRHAITFDYPRAADMPGAGFAAGPCLFKDTMQLGAFYDNNFMLGHASMMVNEGLPLYVCSKLEERYELANKTVAILGMAFKAESDDVRSSLSYKLKRILRFKAKKVVCTDPYVSSDPSLVPLDHALQLADLVIIGTPHSLYRDVQFQQPVIDIWNLRGAGTFV